ncbi:Holliday junction resolvasome DNA-binding subunit [gamma proteobacterium HdN1]|nr:Holliday junction resolvasome DNA-binding subunit [gamma proteobacterium HdN1]
MITHLSGTLRHKQAPQLVIDVSGVGYELDAPMTTFYRLPSLGERVELLTHLVVREDAHVLFGFATQEERSLFRALIKVTGIGPKVALAILSGIEVPQFVRCINCHDVSALIRIPGVGKKTAERLIVEMQDRLPRTLETSLTALQEESLLGENTRPQQAHRPLDEAEAALIALGYKPQEAARCLNALNTEGLSSEQLIRQALKNMVRAG